MQPDELNHHFAHVNAWMKRAQDLSRERRFQLFEQALDALWRRANRTLGEVTLTAIVDRVLYTAAERYPPLASLKVESAGIQFHEFRARVNTLDSGELFDAMGFVLMEFLRVLGSLTGEILTPALHSELSKIAPMDSAENSGSKGQPGARARNDDENAQS